MELQEEVIPKFINKPGLIVNIALRDGPNCFLCDEEFTEDDPQTLDHWIPISKGGTWDISNLRNMHRRCNALKSDTMPIDDYTVIIKSRDPRSRRRAEKRNGRPIVCTLCESGRLLLIGEECGLCGSGPQPATAPRTLQTSPSQCDHDIWHCRECFVDNPSLRQSAIVRIITG